ncbi:hypothetical protein ACFX13_029954 [Malus domestica]
MRRKEKTFRWNIEYGPPQCLLRSSITNHLEDFPSLQGPVILESLTSSEKSGRKVTNEDLQATMVQVLKNLEYSTPKNGYAREVMRVASPKKESVILIFHLLEEKRNKGKDNEGSGVSQPVMEDILEAELPDPLLFSLDSRGRTNKKERSMRYPS